MISFTDSAIETHLRPSPSGVSLRLAACAAGTWPDFIF